MLLRFIPLVALSVACLGTTAPPPVPSAQPPAMPQGPITERYLFTDSLHDIRFIVRTEPDARSGNRCQVQALELSAKGGTTVLQHLDLDDMPVPCPMSDGHFPAIELVDMNFDGLEDLRIMRAAADLTHPSYRYWLFDPRLNGFAAEPMLDSIQDPQFDYSRQMVSSQWYAGKGHRGGSTYKYENGRLVILSTLEKFTEGDHERWVTWGLLNGKFQQVQEKRMPLPQ